MPRPPSKKEKREQQYKERIARRRQELRERLRITYGPLSRIAK